MLKRTIPVVILCVVCCAAFAQLPPTPEDDIDASAKPRLFVAKRLIDLGEVMEGDKVMVSWTLENRGGADLIIDKAKAGCGCTIIKLKDEDKTIPPGGKLVLTAEFNSGGRRGTQRKGVAIHSNDSVEPKLNVTFRAEVKWLYQIKPTSSVIQFRSLQRGDTASKTIDVWPISDDKPVTIADFTIEGGLFSHHIEPFHQKRKGVTGQRIFFTVDEDVPLGPISDTLSLTLKVGDYQRVRKIVLKANIVGDLAVSPVVVDTTRADSRRGQRLAPVTVRSPNRVPFVIHGVEAGPLFTAVVEPVQGKKEGTEYHVRLTVRDDAPPGPFGTTLNIHTDSIDQPLLQIPVFGTVAPYLKVTPPIVLFRQDGTLKGARRLLSLQVPVREHLEITDISCDNKAVEAGINKKHGARYQHLRYLDVVLTGELPEGRHETILRISTNLPNAERIEVPVIIIVPEG